MYAAAHACASPALAQETFKRLRDGDEAFVYQAIDRQIWKQWLIIFGFWGGLATNHGDLLLSTWMGWGRFPSSKYRRKNCFFGSIIAGVI